MTSKLVGEIKGKNMTAIMKFEGKFSFIIYSEDFLHTYPHKYAYNSKTINAIKIISSDSDSTINSRLKKHVFRKNDFLSNFSSISGYCAPLNCIVIRCFRDWWGAYSCSKFHVRWIHSVNCIVVRCFLDWWGHIHVATKRFRYWHDPRPIFRNARIARRLISNGFGPTTITPNLFARGEAFRPST